MTYDDNTTRTTIDGRGIKCGNWDFNHINNRHSRLVQNAAVPSTYDELYDWSDRKAKKGIVGLCIIAVSLFIATFELGVFDDLYIWLIG